MAGKTIGLFGRIMSDADEYIHNLHGPTQLNGNSILCCSFQHALICSPRDFSRSNVCSTKSGSAEVLLRSSFTSMCSKGALKGQAQTVLSFDRAPSDDGREKDIQDDYRRYAKGTHGDASQCIHD